VHLQKAIDGIPDDFAAQLNLGVLLARMGRHAEADQAYDRALALRPGNAEALNNKGWLYYSQKQFPRAIQAFQKAVESAQDYSIAWQNLAAAFQANGQSDKAIETWQKMLDSGFEVKTANLALGNLYLARNRLSDAEGFYRGAIEGGKKADVPAMIGLALVFERQEKLVEAEQLLRQAIDLDPASATAHNNLGSVLERKGDQDQAVAQYRKALSIDKNHRNARRNLVRLGLTVD
jgi:pentatricopeptide repeat protein